MKKVKSILLNLLLLVLAVLGFALAHPTDLCNNGLPFLSYFAFIPVFLLVHRASWKTVWLYGFSYGLFGYCVFVSWLATFNPAAMPVIACMYGLYLMVAFPLMKLVDRSFPKYSFYAQWIVWCAYEFVKTLGFTGFHYGVTAYTHWKILPFIQSASIIGVFGLSAVITFFSALVCTIITEKDGNWGQKILKHKAALISWVCIYGIIWIYGFVSPVDYKDYDTKTVALIQTNTDPWIGGEASYKKDLGTLTRLSDEALAENKDIDFVVWPETAFVPRIEWHYHKRENRNTYNLVSSLLEYVNSKDVPFVIGNDDAELGYDGFGDYTVLDYNASLLFRPGINVIPPKPEKYRKMHLVPFTESFPFKKQLPFIYNLLKENDTHFWEKGRDIKVYDIDGLKFGTPICFEDTFGYISRNFVRNGARAIVNMSNDSWAKSKACQLQHLSMAVFRSVENRVSSVRSTASGQTVIIDPNGKIISSIEPFQEDYLIGEIPYTEDFSPTIYTKFGDYVGYIFLTLSIVLIILGIVSRILSMRKKSETKEEKYGKK